MKCWWCGVEPLSVETYEVHTREPASPVRVVRHPRWPGGDHAHAEIPPTADELAGQAYAMMNEQLSDSGWTKALTR